MTNQNELLVSILKEKASIYCWIGACFTRGTFMRCANVNANIEINEQNVAQ